MRYFLSKDFTQIAETSGTIQNTSHIYSAEISDNAQAGSGLILPPLKKFSFVDKTLYARCHDVTAVEIRVVPFIVDAGAGGSSNSGGGSSVDFDADIEDMWNNPPASSDTSFASVIDKIYED